MRTRSLRFAVVFAALLAATLGFVPNAEAAFHIMRIREVLAQFGGDPRIQFIELEMFAAGQNLVAGHTLLFQDADGSPRGEFAMANNVAGSTNGSSILLGTAAFQAAFNVAPDFVIPEGLLAPFSGRVCFESIDCVAYGDFLGSNTSYGQPAAGFPVSGRASLVLRASPPPARNNSADYSFAAPTPRNNGGTLGNAPPEPPLCFISEDFSDMSRWDQPAASAGLNLAGCGGPEAFDIGFADVVGGALVLTPGVAPLPGVDAPLCLTGLNLGAGQSIKNKNYRLKLNLVGRPGLVNGAIFTRQRYLFDADSETIDVSQASSFGINFSFDNLTETSDHIHPDIRTVCLGELDADNNVEADFPGFLLQTETEYTVILDVDGDDEIGPITLQAKLFPADEEEPIEYLATYKRAAGLGAEVDADLEHEVLIAAVGDASGSLDISALSVCEIPRNQKHVRCLSCIREGGGSVFLSWENPFDAETDEPILVSVNGEAPTSLPGEARSFTLTNPPEGALVITVTNYSGVGVDCSLCENLAPEVFIDGPETASLQDGSATVSLDSSRSTDGDANDGSQQLNRVWDIVSAPQGSSPAVDNPSAVSVVVTVDLEGEYTVRLTITDSGCPGSTSAVGSAEHTLLVDSSQTANLMRPGDCNLDGRLDISDAVCLLGHLFLGNPASVPCEGSTVLDPGNLALLDANGSGRVDLSDAVHGLNFLFAGGSPPVLGTQCTQIPGCPSRCVP